MKRRTLLLLLLTIASCSQPTAPPAVAAKPKSNVVLISIDTTRSDAIGIYGNKTIQTPAIDSVARAGVLFQSHISNVPLTLPSHSVMLTGELPTHTGIHDNHGSRLASTAITAASVFKQNGYRTAAFVSSVVLDHRFGLDRGFDLYDDHIAAGSEGSDVRQNERIAADTAASAIDWLKSNSQNPFFLFVHFYDPHARYHPPEPFLSRYQNPYLGEIAYVDEQIQKLLDALAPVRSNTFLFITSDHGEGMGEHGELGHGLFLYDSTLHVPLIFSGPGITAGARITTQTQMTDLTPTMLGYAGLAAPASIDGHSLAPLVRKENWTESQALSESYYPQDIGWSPLISLRTSRWKYIEAPQQELYDLAQDPAENKNVYAEQKGVAHPFSEKTLRYKAEGLAQKKVPVHDADLDEQLRSLGYLSGTSKPKEGAILPDPKQKLEVWKLYERAMYSSMEGDKKSALISLAKAAQIDPQNAVLFDTMAQFLFDENPQKAMQYWQQALRIDPENSTYHHKLSLVLKRLGQIQKALEEDALALKLDPEMQEALLGSAVLLMQMQRPNDALPFLQRSLTLDPRNSAAAYQTGSAYATLGNLAQAESFYLKAIEYNPSLPYPYYGLGILKGQSGDVASAVSYFEKTLQADPAFSQAYYNLGVLYQRSDRKEEAIRAFESYIQHADPALYATRIASAKQLIQTLQK